MIEGPISNDKEKTKICSPPGTPLAKNIFWNSLMNVKIFIIMFEGPISNIKANKIFALPLGTPLTIFFFFSSLGQYKKIIIYITSVYLVLYKRYDIKWILVLKEKKKKRRRKLDYRELFALRAKTKTYFFTTLYHSNRDLFK